MPTLLTNRSTVMSVSPLRAAHLVNCASTPRASGRSPLKSETEANSIDLSSELPDPGARRGEGLIAVDEWGMKSWVAAKVADSKALTAATS
jgi:hypothetical protein